MMKDYVNLLKTFEYFEKISVKDYVDVKDGITWKVAEVKSFNKYSHRTSLEVHYDGTNMRLNEFIDFPSAKLAPFRRYTFPYTGPQIPIRKELPRRTLDEHRIVLDTLTTPSHLKPTFINQYLRGELFIFMDNFAKKQLYQSNRQLLDGIEFFEKFILRYGTFLLANVQLLNQLQKQNFSDPFLIYVHPGLALLFASTQFLYTCNTMLTRFNERKKYDLNLNKEIKQLIIQANVESYCIKIMQFKGIQNKGLPWSLKKEALITLHTLRDGNSPYSNLMDNKQVGQILQYMKYFVRHGVFKQQEAQAKSIDLIFNLLLQGNFQGRLKGINELKKILDLHEYKDKLIKEFQSRNIINFFIDNNNFNGEIFKRSIPIFEFAYRHRLLTRNHLSQIVALHKDKDEVQLKLLYSSLSEFNQFLEVKTANELFALIVELPLDENLIGLVRDFTLNGKRNWHLRSDDESPGMEFLWKLICDQSKTVNQACQSKINEAFATILKKNYSYPSYTDKQYITEAIKGIYQKKNIHAFLDIIHETLRESDKFSYAIESATKNINVVKSVIEVLKYQKGLSETMISNAFEFLQKLNQVCKQKISFQQIEELWRLKQCRVYLLKLMRMFDIKKGAEYKRYHKIIQKQLTVTQIKQIFERIFLKPKQMDNYQTISQDVFQTVDELLIYYNHQSQGINYNVKHTIRTISIDRCFGLSFYLNIINNCTDPIIVNKAIYRYIQYHLRLLPDHFKNQQAEIQNKVKLWMKALQDCSQLKKHMLRTYIVLLNQIKGRMKSLNILEPQKQAIRVFNKKTEQIKQITLPKYSSIWKFRHEIIDAFDLKDNSSFQIWVKGQPEALQFQFEEDYSVAFIPSQREATIITIVPKKQTHPHHIAISKFKARMVDKVGEKLYHMLSDQKLQPQIRTILQELPFVSEIKINFDCKKYREKDDLFDSKCIGHLCYQLKILKEVKNQSFIRFLYKEKFLDHIANIFIRGFTEYNVLTQAITFFLELIKFSKIIPQFTLSFEEEYILKLIHYSTQSDYPSYIIKCFSLLKYMAEVGVKAVASVFKCQNILQILKTVLLNNIKGNVDQNIFYLCQKTNSFSLLNSHLKNILTLTFLREYQKTCKPLFDLITRIIAKSDRQILNELMPSIKTLVRQIRKSDIQQKPSQQKNELLNGFLQIVTAYAAKYNRIVDLLQQTEEQFLLFLVCPCLFNTNLHIKFRSTQLRQRSLELLNVRNEPNSIALMYSLLDGFMKKGTWRKANSWSITAFKMVDKQFTGLTNLAATCYINSLLQQLYFIEPFRDQIFSIEAKNINEKQNILHEIQQIFGRLKFSQNQFCSTKSLCQNFILDGSPIDPRVQTDVDQFFHSLMDKLQRNLKCVGKKEIIQDIFNGQFSNLIEGVDCQHASETIQNFLSIRLQIIDKKSLEAALQKFIKEEVLEGQNAYFCERCDKKIKAVKRVCLKSLPQILIITFKRFEFNFDTMEKFKLNTLCSFEQNMNFAPYTRQGIQKDVQLKKQNFQYKLKGVIIHHGSSEAGHYTSYIRTDDKNWNYFDDEKITPFDIKDLSTESFGGFQENPFGEDEQKKKSAYLLFYQKVKSTLKVAPIAIKETTIYKQIQMDNIQNTRISLLFEANLQRFLRQRSDIDGKIFFIYLHTVLLRNNRKTDKLSQFYYRAIKLLKNKQFCTWYLKQVNQMFVTEFMIYGDLQAKYLVTFLVAEAIKGCPPNLNFLKTIVQMIDKKGIYPMVKLFSVASSTHEEYYKFLKDINFSSIVMQIIKNKDYACKIQFDVSKEINQFGHPISNFPQKHFIFQPVNLLQALQHLQVNISEEDFHYFLLRIQKVRTLRSLAVIFARRFSKQMNQLNTFVNQCLTPNILGKQWNEDNSFIFIYLLEIMQQIILSFAQNPAKQKIQLIIGLYLKALNQFLKGYKSMVLLLNSLYKLCSRSPLFFQILCELQNLKENKNLMKSIKEWIKDANGSKEMIVSGKWSYWFKAKSTHTLSQFQPQPDTVKFGTLINAILQKKMPSRLEDKTISVGSLIKYMDNQKLAVFKVLKITGYTAEIKANYSDKVVIVIAEDQCVIDCN